MQTSFLCSIRKMMLLCLLSMFMLFGFSSTTYAIASGDILVDGEPIVFSHATGKPTVIDGRTYIPLRVMGDAMGYDIGWHSSSQVAVAKSAHVTIELKINSPIARINGKEAYIDIREGVPFTSTTALLLDGKTYIPLRFVTENLGYELEFKDGITYLSKKVLGAGPINPWEYQKLLGKGMDVDWSKTTAGRYYYNEQTVKDFKEMGISHVRIRIKDPADETLFTSLDKQIADCLEYGLIPIIAYQADEFKNEPTEKNIQSVIKWWATVAQRYQNISHLLSFDLFIEATDALNKQPEKLNEIYERLVTEIRKTNPTRIIMISPRLRSDSAYLHELDIPSQHNGYLMAEWHFYASGPSKINDRKLWTTGTQKEKDLILEKIHLALAWQKETGIPTWVGAWMAGNYNDGNDYTIEEQVVFADYMTKQLIKAGIPFAVNSDTKFYNRETNHWIEEMSPVRDIIFK